jgi:hypothetical protein
MKTLESNQRSVLLRAAWLVATVCVLLISSLAALAQGRSDEALLCALLVQTAHTDRLLQISGVVGTATGLNEANVPVVKVFVAHPAAAAGLPGQLNGVQVSVDVTGPIVAFAPPAGKPNSLVEARSTPRAASIVPFRSGFQLETLPLARFVRPAQSVAE